MTAQTSENALALHALVKKVSAQNLLSAVAGSLLFRPAEAYSELELDNTTAKLELLAYEIYPFFGVGAQESITPRDTTECFDLLDKLFDERITSHLSPPSPTYTPPSSVDRLLFHVKLHTEIVRGSAYPQQTSEEINQLLGPFETKFSALTRIGPKRAVDILWGIIRTQEKRFIDLNSLAIGSGEEFKKRWREIKIKHPKDWSEDDNIFMGHFQKEDAAGEYGFIAALNDLMAEQLPLGPSDVSGIAPSITPADWSGLIALLGLTENERKTISAPVEISQKPLFVMRDDKIIISDLSNALDVLFNKFDSLSKGNPSFDSYNKAKGRWLEKRTRECLLKVFPASSIFSNLSYPDPDKPGPATTELDCAVLWGPFLLLIENKAKQFRLESQLGDLPKLRSDLKNNIEDAFEQAKRAARYIEKEDSPSFKEVGTDRELKIQKDKLRRTYLLTISHHQLAGLANRLASLQDLHLFRDGEFPFSASISDFEILTEHSRSPDVLLHYIERRLETQKGAVDIMADELDLFGVYLDTRLQPSVFIKRKTAVTGVTFQGFSERFNKWALYKLGELLRPTIQLKIPNEIYRVLEELRGRADDGARWISFALLDLSDKQLNAIASGLRDIEKASLQPGLIRRMAFQDQDIAISILATMDLSSSTIQQSTAKRVILEKYRRKVKRSIGIGILQQDKSKPFEAAAYAEGPWAFDAGLERQISDEPFLPAPGQKLPGRNEPCLCGSGKKFKKCCLNKNRG